MERFPVRWDGYARVQEQLATRLDVDHHAWALESTLNRLADSAPAPDEIERALRSGRRKERHRAANLRDNPPDLSAEQLDLDGDIDARDALDRMRAKTARKDWLLLVWVAAGHDYKAISVRLGVKPGALRARTLRLRRSLRPGIATTLDALTGSLTVSREHSAAA
jgi:hypothetical protein